MAQRLELHGLKDLADRLYQQLIRDARIEAAGDDLVEKIQALIHRLDANRATKPVAQNLRDIIEEASVT